MMSIIKDGISKDRAGGGRSFLTSGSIGIADNPRTCTIQASKSLFLESNHCANARLFCADSSTNCARCISFCARPISTRFRLPALFLSLFSFKKKKKEIESPMKWQLQRCACHGRGRKRTARVRARCAGQPAHIFYRKNQRQIRFARVRGLRCLPLLRAGQRRRPKSAIPTTRCLTGYRQASLLSVARSSSFRILAARRTPLIYLVEWSKRMSPTANPSRAWRPLRSSAAADAMLAFLLYE